MPPGEGNSFLAKLLSRKKRFVLSPGTPGLNCIKRTNRTDIPRSIAVLGRKGKIGNMPTNRCSQSSATCFTSKGVCVPLPCGRWQCPECAKSLALQWAMRVRLGTDNRLSWFWTLTMSGKIQTPERAYELLPKLWDSLRKKMQRSSDEWTYVAFVEGQPKRRHMPISIW